MQVSGVHLRSDVLRRSTILVISIVMLLWPAFTSAQETERVHEEIEVVNVEVPLRVFFKKKPVKGLQKSDFTLFIDGKEREINGFYEVRKKIENAPTKGEPRLYVLIFNVLTHVEELEKGLDTLFGKIIRPGDRVMVLTNTMYLKDKALADPADYLEKLKKILHMEWLKMKQTISILEYNLRYLASSFKMSIKNLESGQRGGMGDPERQELIITRFLDDYHRYLDEFKATYFNPQQDQYLKIADYLKSQKVEKWVLNFYQTPEFPMLKSSSEGVYWAIAYYARMAQVPNPYTQGFEINLGKPERSHVETISKIFLNTGATFHMLLMNSHMPDFHEDYQYTAVPIDSEHISREITRMTGGEIIRSNDIGKFVKKVSTREDVYYMITYAPDPKESKGKLEVRLPDKKYQAVYDNRQRPRYLKRAVEAMEAEIPQIRFTSVESKEGLLHLQIGCVRLEAGKEGGKTGTLILSIKVLNDEAREVAGTKKSFTCRAATIPLRLLMPGLKKGRYQFVMEVNDVMSGKNDVELKDIDISEDIVLEPGEEAFRFIPAAVPGKQGASGEIMQNAELASRFENKNDPSFSKEGIGPGVLPSILEKVADYCDRLRTTSLNFFCIEEIKEIAFKSLEWRGKSRREENAYTYGYQLVKDNGEAREKRALFEVNGREDIKDNVTLATRFKYAKVVYGPLIFNREAQKRYRYEIIGKKDWNGKQVYVVEAVPNAGENLGVISGRFWVDEADYSILKIEVYQRSLTNFGAIEKMAGEHHLEPRITIINEYDIVKKGVRFPGKLYYEEAYRDRQGRMVVQSMGNVTFKDYQFFVIEARVTKEERR